MGSIIFLRHGQAKNNTEKILAGRTPGIPLTENGIKQAEAAGEFLEHLNISAIYSSPIERARNTAEIVSKHTLAKTSIDERLVELEMGNFTGMPYDDLFSKHGNVFLKFYQGDKTIAREGVETFLEVKQRVIGIVDHVIENHPDENVVLVTHMDPIKAMIANTVSLSPQNLFELIIANASLNIFKNYDGKFALKAINLMHPSRFDQDW